MLPNTILKILFWNVKISGSFGVFPARIINNKLTYHLSWVNKFNNIFFFCLITPWAIFRTIDAKISGESSLHFNTSLVFVISLYFHTIMFYVLVWVAKDAIHLFNIFLNWNRQFEGIHTEGIQIS